jgi:hypothetical protein
MVLEEIPTFITMMEVLLKPKSLEHNSIQQGCFLAWTSKNTEVLTFTRSPSNITKMAQVETTISKLTMEVSDPQQI